MNFPRAEDLLKEADPEYLEDLARKLMRAGFGINRTEILKSLLAEITTSRGMNVIHDELTITWPDYKETW